MADRRGHGINVAGRAGGATAARPVAGRPDDGVPPLAAPAGVPGQPVFLEFVGTWIYSTLSAAPPVRRADRSAGAGTPGCPPGGGRDDLLDGCRLLPGAGPAGAWTTAAGPRRGSRCSAWPGCAWASIAPSDVLLGVAFGVTDAALGFRLFAPNEVFPVAYRRAQGAHLDVGGARGEAIRRAAGGPAGHRR